MSDGSDSQGDAAIDLAAISVRAVADPQLVQYEKLRIQIERLMGWQKTVLRKTILDYDQLIANPHTDPALKLRAMESKVRALTALGDVAARMAHGIRHCESIRVRELSTDTEKRKIAERLIRTKKVGHRAGEIELSDAQPKVKMFMPGCDFKATVGLDLIKREPPQAIVEPP